MTESRKIIRAFLASPGDLQDERKAIYGAIKEFNETWADELGYQVELLGWEETVSGFGRPQRLINKDVDRCDLFLGLMWKRWGTAPDLKGKYTSGFHEEFERSIKRRKESGKPEISLFFKEIDKEFLIDRGPDLLKVLKFKDKIISEKSILFRTFSTIREIEELIRKCVSHYVVRIKEDELSVSQNNFEQQTKAQAIEKSPDRDLDISSPLSFEGFRFLEKFIVKIQGSDTLDNLSAYDIARFRLLASSVSKEENDESQLGVHDINILFANRNKSVFGETETNSLLRFGFQHLHNENTPLWCWYSKRRNSDYNDTLIYSFIGQNDNLKAGAIRILTLLGIELNDKGPIEKKAIINFWFSEKSSAKIRNAALEYFKINGYFKDFDIVNSEYERNDHSTSRTALESMISILHRTGKEGAAENLVLETQFNLLDPSILDDVLREFSKLEINQLQNGLEHQNPKVRLRSLSVLNERGAISVDIAENFTKDNDPSIRYEALNILIGHGKEISDNEAREILVKPQKNYGLKNILSGFSNTDVEGEVYLNKFILNRLRLLFQKNEKELMELNNKALVYGDDPYFILAHKYFSKYANELRSNIDDKFNDYFDKRLDRLKAIDYKTIKALNYETKIDDLVKNITDSKDVTTKNLTRKGLDILCKQDKLEDINRIRENLKTNYSGASILDAEYFQKNGNLEDIELMANVQFAIIDGSVLQSESSSEYQDAIAKLAYELGKSSISDLFFLELQPKIIYKILELCSETAFKKISDEALFKLLNRKENEIRRAASLLAVRAFTKKRLEAILDKYVSGDDYRYYNVIHWLDLGVSMSRKESKRVVSRVSGKL